MLGHGTIGGQPLASSSVAKPSPVDDRKPVVEEQNPAPVKDVPRKPDTGIGGSVGALMPGT